MKKFVRILVGLAVLVALLVPLGAVSAQTWASGFQLQNLGSATAGITIKFYDSGTGAEVVAAQITDSIPAMQSKTYFAVSNGGLPASFAGSAVVTSDQDLRAIHNLYASAGGTWFASSAGYNAGASSVNMPLIMRNNSGFNTWFAVQNAGSAPATVTVVFTAGSAGSNYTAPPVTIQPGASRYFYQATETNLGTTFVGSAVATATGAPIVATVVQVGPNTVLAYDGFVASSTGAIMPLFQANNAGYVSGIQIMNVGSSSTSVTVSYTALPGYGSNNTETQTIPAGASRTFGLTLFGSSLFVGSARVTGNSANQPLVAIVNQLNSAAAKATAYSAFRPEDAKQRISLPLIMDRNSGYYTGFTIMNIGLSSATVTVTYYKQGSSAPARTDTYTIPAGGTQLVINNGMFPDVPWVGSAIVQGGSASDQLVAVVNELSTMGTGDNFMTYNGFGY